MMLISEMYKDASGTGNASRWSPFIKTMQLHMLSRRVMKELEGRCGSNQATKQPSNQATEQPSNRETKQAI
jgi:hypothetical protein